ncbi:MAG: hypothetical protein WBH76_02995 [Dictyoglomaceae bacterium]
MRKLGLLLVLVLLVVPAFAANINTSSWIGVGFHTRVLPFSDGYGPAWGTWASGNINYSLSGSSNLGSVNGNVQIDVAGASLGSNWVSGTITFSKVAGLLDLSFHKGTLDVSGTQLLGSGFSGSTGIKGVVGVAPLTLTVGYAPADTWWKSDLVKDSVLAVRGDASLSAPLAISLYGLITKGAGTTSLDYAVGASATPITAPVSLTVFGEYAGSEQLVGATVKALGGKVTVGGNYKLQAGDYFVSATVDGVVPNLKAYVEYNTAESYTLWGYVSASLPVPVGSLSLGAALANGTDTLLGGFAKHSYSFGGGVTHDLLVGYGFDWDDYSANGWNRGNLTGDLTGANELWGVNVTGKVYLESKLMIGF